MTQIYTIGFTKKSAEKFFNLLINNQIKTLVDIRLNNETQLSGFAKGNDLKYFLKIIANINYVHDLKYAPTKDLLNDYRKKFINWDSYTVEYIKLIKERDILKNLNIEVYNNNCFLCSEDKPDKCHRRLLVEYFKQHFKDIEIKHLI